MSSISSAIRTLLIVLVGPAVLTFLRFQAILKPSRPKPKRSRQTPTHAMIILGSGGHTAEMIAMLERAVYAKEEQFQLSWSHFNRRTWLVSTGDALSAQRAKDFEGSIAETTGKTSGTWDIRIVPRAREIHQPIYTAPHSSLRCFFACLDVLLRRPDGEQTDLPDIILCNGPATATIMVFTSILLRFFNIRGCHSRGKMRTIYVESFARVKKLSLSGKLLSTVVDRFLVQWPQLETTGGRAEYVGILV